jgi:hypothetical protein
MPFSFFFSFPKRKEPEPQGIHLAELAFPSSEGANPFDVFNRLRLLSF